MESSNATVSFLPGILKTNSPSKYLTQSLTFRHVSPLFLHHDTLNHSCNKPLTIVNLTLTCHHPTLYSHTISFQLKNKKKKKQKSKKKKMMGESIQHNLMIDVPPWSISDDQLAGGSYSGGISDDYLLMASLQRYLPANEVLDEEDAADLADPPIDAYSCDEFRMYEFKIRRCARGRSHDWTECPYAHPGEKARRRDPKVFHYSGTACPDFRKGNCKRGDACEYAHGVFECWLHPARYRTQPCKDGTACRRRVCFFAHTPEQLRILPSPQKQSPRAVLESYDGSPMRLHAVDSYFGKGMISSLPNLSLMSPPMSPTADSPPMSPARRGSWQVGSPVNEVLASLRKLQLSKVKSVPRGSLDGVLGLKPEFCGLPAVVSGETPAGFDGFNDVEPVERVESGRALRAKMYERFSRESGLGQVEVGSGPDVGWVSEIVK